MGVDKLGVDKMGVDEMGSRRSGNKPMYQEEPVIMSLTLKKWGANRFRLVRASVILKGFEISDMDSSSKNS